MSTELQPIMPSPSMNSLQTMTRKVFLRIRVTRLQGLLIVSNSRQGAEQRSSAEQSGAEREELTRRNNRCSTSSKSGGSCRKPPGRHLSAASPKVTNDELQKAGRVALGSLSPSSVLGPAEPAWQHQCLNTTPVGGQAGRREGGREGRVGGRGGVVA